MKFAKKVSPEIAVSSVPFETVANKINTIPKKVWMCAKLELLLRNDDRIRDFFNFQSTSIKDLVHRYDIKAIYIACSYAF